MLDSVLGILVLSDFFEAKSPNERAKASRPARPTRAARARGLASARGERRARRRPAQSAGGAAPSSASIRERSPASDAS
jgi:hypothetical protein